MDEHDRPGLGTIGAILGGMVLVIFVALVFLGGQTSTILSNVGAPIGGDCCEPGGDSGEQGGPAGEASDDDDGKVADVDARPPELLIIRTGQLEVEVADLPAAVTAAGELMSRLGGYVGASEESASGAEAYASVVYRVPAVRWDDAMAGIRGLAGRVLQGSVESEEVTGRVVDLDARIRNLRATEASFQAIMVQAVKIDDVLAVQDQLTHVRDEIERLVAQKETLEERAAFGTLTVVFRLPVPPAVEVVQRGWDPLNDVDASVGTLAKIAQRGVSFAIWLSIVALPVLPGFVIAAVIAWQVGRFVMRYRARERSAQAG
jgi:Domain of unknown function (DUF4349)